VFHDANVQALGELQLGAGNKQAKSLFKTLRAFHFTCKENFLKRTFPIIIKKKEKKSYVTFNSGFKAD
jgi:hypothetical protein